MAPRSTKPTKYHRVPNQRKPSQTPSLCCQSTGKFLPLLSGKALIHRYGNLPGFAGHLRANDPRLDNNLLPANRPSLAGERVVGCRSPVAQASGERPCSNHLSNGRICVGQ